MTGTADGGASLASRELRAALRFTGELAECESEQELSAQTRRLRELVGADTMILGAVEHSPEGPPKISAEEDPPGWFDAECRETFARFSHQQPLVVSHFGGLTRRAEKVSDFLTARQWRRREIYNDFYRRFGLGWEIAAPIHASPGLIGCASLQRTGGDFGERDRQLLDLVAPHLRAAHRRVAERAAATASDARPHPTPEAIARRLPLSAREAEVLARLAAGGPNAAIARDLGISPHTVARHLERIYAKLGVQNRAAATAAAFEALLG